MRTQLLNDLLPTDARLAGRTLLASLESAEVLEVRDRARDAAFNDARGLAFRAAREFPGNAEIQDGFERILTAMVPGAEGPAMESLGSVIGSIFGKKGKPKTLPEEQQWNQEHRAQVAKFLQELEKTYLSSAWLDKQKFVTGDVPASDISIRFMCSNQVGKGALLNVNVARKNVEGFCKAWAQVLKSIETKVNSIHEQVKRDTKGAEDQDEKALEVVRKAIKDFNAIPDPMTKFPKMSGTALGNLVPYIDKHGEADVHAVPEPQPPTTLTALTKDEVLYGAKLVKEMLTDENWDPSWGLLRFRWLDFKDGEAFTGWIYDADYDLYEEYYERFYTQSYPESWTLGLRNMLDKYKTAVAIVKYIDRSIK